MPTFLMERFDHSQKLLAKKRAGNRQLTFFVGKPHKNIQQPYCLCPLTRRYWPPRGPVRHSPGAEPHSYFFPFSIVLPSWASTSLIGTRVGSFPVVFPMDLPLMLRLPDESSCQTANRWPAPAAAFNVSARSVSKPIRCQNS
jgi:hypothetical protein